MCINENFNFVKGESTKSILPYNEILKSNNVKALILVQEKLSYLENRNKTDFIEIISGNLVISILVEKSTIYFITSKIPSPYLRKKVDVSLFTLSLIIERNKHRVCLFVFQFIPKEICIKNENESERAKLNTLTGNIDEANGEYGSTSISVESWKPIGFLNPKGYCYLNSVVQLLISCKDFYRDIEHHIWTCNEITADTTFVRGIFDLIVGVRKKDETKIFRALNIVQSCTTESAYGDDVYKCFMNLLTRVSNVIKTNTDEPSDHFSSYFITLSKKPKTAFKKFNIRNPGFVFDNFYGQLTFQTICAVCKHVFNESFQMIKSLPLPVPKSNSSVTLNSCIDLFFNESNVVVDESMKFTCKCQLVSLKSLTKLTHGPKYLFIYLNRGSYTHVGYKNNTLVTCDDLTINIKTLENKSIKYKLISVIDHVGNSAGGHYYCKCSYETEEWWLLNDSQVQQLEYKSKIVTKNAIVFLFKKT